MGNSHKLHSMILFEFILSLLYFSSSLLPTYLFKPPIFVYPSFVIPGAFYAIVNPIYLLPSIQ
jgi:hypothetical protein